MLAGAIFNRVYRTEHQAIADIRAFLRANELNMDTTVEVFITVTQNDKLVACGGIAGNIIKCVAISPQLRGAGLALSLATELVNLAYERHHSQLFIYTKTQNADLFRQCGFYPIADVPGIVVLMENSPCRLQRYAARLATQRRP
ncbi:GNAT family N-acetyltransferase, partial [Serratia rubidaea]|nr:GNAT family N-acetyltransferase [Serratia rubidaea]